MLILMGTPYVVSTPAPARWASNKTIGEGDPSTTSETSPPGVETRRRALGIMT